MKKMRIIQTGALLTGLLFAGMYSLQAHSDELFDRAIVDHDTLATARVPLAGAAKNMFSILATLGASDSDLGRLTKCSHRVAMGATTISYEDARLAINNTPHLLSAHASMLGAGKIYEVACGVSELIKRVSLYELIEHIARPHAGVRGLADAHCTPNPCGVTSFSGDLGVDPCRTLLTNYIDPVVRNNYGKLVEDDATDATTCFGGNAAIHPDRTLLTNSICAVTDGGSDRDCLNDLCGAPHTCEADLTGTTQFCSNVCIDGCLTVKGDCNVPCDIPDCIEKDVRIHPGSKLCVREICGIDEWCECNEWEPVVFCGDVCIKGDLKVLGDCDCTVTGTSVCECPPGPQGEKGETGEKGPQGEQGVLPECFEQDFKIAPDNRLLVREICGIDSSCNAASDQPVRICGDLEVEGNITQNGLCRVYANKVITIASATTGTKVVTVKFKPRPNNTTSFGGFIDIYFMGNLATPGNVSPENSDVSYYGRYYLTSDPDSSGPNSVNKSTRVFEGNDEFSKVGGFASGISHIIQAQSTDQGITVSTTDGVSVTLEVKKNGMVGASAKGLLCIEGLFRPEQLDSITIP